MAGDWIKMRVDLYRDPKVIVIADHLMQPDSDLSRHISQMTRRDSNVTRNVMRNVTVGGLVTVWGVIRTQGKRDGDDATLPGVSVSVIDDIAELPGFGEALESVGWVEQRHNSLVFPKFYEEHNADYDEQRKKNRERQRRYRENQKRNVTVTLHNAPREEKRREEKSKETTNNCKSQKFVRPTLDEVAAYCAERSNNVDASKFIDYYSANGWKVGKNSMKDWRAAVRTWEKNERPNNRGPTGRRTQEDELRDFLEGGE